jgi:predicted DNA binding CopG/RHH family protein
MKKLKQSKKIINDVKDIPEFDTEREEQAFWETHHLNVNLFNKSNNKALLNLPLKRSSKASTKPISLRLEHDLDARLREVAKRKGANYQTLLKDFVLERVYEEEKRLGIIK